MKFISAAFVLCLSLATAGCAINSGLQTYDLPKEGLFETSEGVVFKVMPIRQSNLKALNTSVSTVSQENVLPLFQQTARYSEYRLGAFDVLSIHLWAHPDIAAATDSAQAGFQLDTHGYIDLPLIGRYHAAGKTVNQVTRDLRNLFSRYLKQSDVTVRVLSYQGQSFSVQGNVQKAGQFFLNNQPVSVYAAIGLAGGISDKGNTNHLQLIRNGITYELNPLQLEKMGYSLHQLYLQPHDTLYVTDKENHKIYVMGEAGKNQALTLREQGMTLSDALGESMGLNPYSASAKGVYIVRTDMEQELTTIYTLDLMALGNFGLANQFQLQSNDIIYVDATGLTRWQRLVNQLVPFSSALYNFQRLGQ